MRVRIALLAFLFTIAPLAGCASMLHQPAANHGHIVPSALQATATNLDRLILLCVVVAGVAVAAYFVAPEGHELSMTAAIGAGAILILSLLLRVSLWIIPKVVVCLFVISAIALAYELYVKLIRDKESIGRIVDDGEGVIAQGVMSVATISGMTAARPAATPSAR